MMTRLLFITAFLCGTVSAQIVIYLPATGPHEEFVSNCTTASLTVCTVDDATGLTVIDPATGTNTVIGAFGIAATGPANHMADPRGLLRIKAISGNNITLMTMAGADQPFTGVWETGGNATYGEPAAPQRIRKMTAFTLPDAGPWGTFDGKNGPLTRSWATGTHNGLDLTNGIVVSSNVATVKLGYDVTALGINVVSGIKMSVWGTTNSTLSGVNGSEFTITVVSTGSTSILTFPVSIADGNYTHNDICGATPGNENVIGGTKNCVQISFRATSTNAFWTSIQSFTSSPSTLPYDGTGPNMAQYAVFCAYRIFVDQKAQAYLDYCLKHVKKPEQYGGNNFPANIAADDMGNYSLSAQVSGQSAYLAMTFGIVAEFVTTAQKTHLKAALNNDIQDATPCTPVLPQPISVITGTTSAADLTHITITGGSGTNDFYKNNIVDALTGAQHSAGVISAYDGTTKIATLTTFYTCGGNPCGWDSGQVPSNTATFAVLESFTAASTTKLANVVVTGYNTHWLTTLHPGDYLFGIIRWSGFLNPQELGGLVVSVSADDTAILFSNSLNGLSTIPGAGWITPPFNEATDCGLQFLDAGWTGAIGSQPSQYPPRGGNSWKLMDNIGGNYAAFQIMKHLALAPYDTRSVTALAKAAILGLDENLDLTMNYMGGNWSGSNYGPGRAQEGQYQIAWSLSTVPGFPSLDLSGGWLRTYQEWKQYAQYPDIIGVPRFGDSAGQRPRPEAIGLDYGAAFNPLTTSSKYITYWTNHVRQLTTAGSVNSTNLLEYALRKDPNAPELDHKTQPLQYLMVESSRAASMGLGGRTYPATYLGGDFISRNAWDGDPCATHIWVNAQMFAGDHGGPNVQPDYQVWHCGMLKGDDNMPPENQPAPGTGPWVQFDGADHFKDGGVLSDPAVLAITRFTGPVPYGDPNSQIACGKRDDKGAYTTTQTRNEWTFCHFKPLGGLTDDIFIHFRNVVTPSSHVITARDFFTENGQTTNFYTTYPEGTTSYPGSGGCGSLNTNKVVLSQQDGGTSVPIAGIVGDGMLPGVSPGPRTANLITTYLPIGTATINCDGSSFSGAQGNSERVSIYGGSSVGGTSTSLQYFTADAIVAQPTTTVPSVLLSGGAGWGVNQTSKSVMAVSTDGTDHNSAAFTTTYSGTGQVAVLDLIPGTYSVKIGGVPISGSPLSVPTKDNSLHFIGAAGAVTVDLQGIAGGGTPVNSGRIVH